MCKRKKWFREIRLKVVQHVALLLDFLKTRKLHGKKCNSCTSFIFPKKLDVFWKEVHQILKRSATPFFAKSVGFSQANDGYGEKIY